MRHSLCPGYSRSTIVVDGCSPGGLYEPGDACVAPTQIYRPHRAWDAPVGARFVPPDGGQWKRGQFGLNHGMRGHHRGRWLFTWRSLRTGRRMLFGVKTLLTTCVKTSFTLQSRWTRQGARHERRGQFGLNLPGHDERRSFGEICGFGIPRVRGIRGQQSGSMVVHLEVFTNRATHASPLHRFIDPTAGGMHPSAPVSFLRMGDSGKGDSLV